MLIGVYSFYYIMLKRKLIIGLIFCILASAFTLRTNQRNFKGTLFDSVMITEFSPPTEAPFPSQRKDLLKQKPDTAATKLKAMLTKPESEEIYRLLTDKKSYNSKASVCWMPHLGIYFLNKGVIVNYIEVCLDCNKLMSLLRIKDSEPVKLGKLKLATGLAPAFRKFINSLLVKYHFQHLIEPGSIYDK